MKPDQPEEKKAGRRIEWPTLWHPRQIPMPWGSAKRLTAAKARAAEKAAKEQAEKERAGAG